MGLVSHHVGPQIGGSTELGMEVNDDVAPQSTELGMALDHSAQATEPKMGFGHRTTASLNSHINCNPLPSQPITPTTPHLILQAKTYTIEIKGDVEFKLRMKPKKRAMEDNADEEPQDQQLAKRIKQARFDET